MNKDSQEYQLKLLHQLAKEIDKKLKNRQLIKDRKEKLDKLNNL